jgi:hypothetical protein
LFAVAAAVGIVASMAIDAKSDLRLKLIFAEHLFDPNVARIALRRAGYLRKFAYRFLELCSADLSESVVSAGVEEAAQQSKVTPARPRRGLSGRRVASGACHPGPACKRAARRGPLSDVPAA